MSHDDPTPGYQTDSVLAVREKMALAECVFDFMVHPVPEGGR